MSRDNLCIGLERNYEETHPIATKLFRKIIDNSDGILEPEECMNLYDIFQNCLEEFSENYMYITNTYLV